ncbi:MAG: tRNA uridine-5-carboxymethylaminomethyl(34) synthesis GTPase MnmE [Acholeplasmatales bacterium]|jgi:tRNA modification GTPase|nr:tRNA uridine-5-carboxymethylaminomethyl(34) synthesis GTPase MnmE [Acholeplasmatales bacterium]MDD7395186.1 tRNA uridine-5-carboxymethylaminomethyl(34) synthesis GTPase MnmE [Acholeplasmatales bacterium]
MKLFDDTIIGISTALSKGAISIIRLSGDDAIKIVNKVFKGIDLSKVEPNTINYGHIVDFDSCQIIDEVLVSIFKAPKSYTKEDVVEINCHGGLFVTNKIYEQLVLLGARPSEPGEFTKRAFLSGRIDLTKAEAVMDVINAENSAALKIANSALNGKISTFVDQKRQELLDIIATISVNIDYPEYDDVEQLTNEDILPKLKTIKLELEDVLNNAKSAKLLKNGINTVIVGKPNVGKSSLLNTLIGENKAIVTNIPGTTRDIVEASINLGQVTLNLIDTAGIRITEDVVEKIGVEKSKEQINKADIILCVLDGSEPINEQDKEILNEIKNKCHLTIINKIDLEQKINLGEVDDNVLFISTKNNNTIKELENKILETLNLNNLFNKDITYISNARQLEKINFAIKALDEALTTIENEATIDFVDIDIRKAWLYLGEIVGQTSTDNLLDELFSKFCLGK